MEPNEYGIKETILGGFAYANGTPTNWGYLVLFLIFFIAACFSVLLVLINRVEESNLGEEQ